LERGEKEKGRTDVVGRRFGRSGGLGAVGGGGEKLPDVLLLLVEKDLVLLLVLVLVVLHHRCRHCFVGGCVW